MPSYDSLLRHLGIGRKSAPLDGLTWTIRVAENPNGSSRDDTSVIIQGTRANQSSVQKPGQLST